MKRGILIVSLLIISLIALGFVLRTNSYKLTGEATTQSTSLNITVFQVPPVLAILAPKNETYLSANYVLLNFTSLYADNLFYNIDNGANNSVSSPTYFNTTSGSHTLYLYANNSNATTLKNVTFYINSSMFIIKDNEFEDEDDAEEDNNTMERHSKKGTTTEFLDYSYEELQNLDNIILENPLYGKILFNEVINLTNDSNSSDNIVD